MMSDIRMNMQQQPKSVGHLINFKARPGHKLVQQDTSAVEPRVITNFSKDETMWSLYGPNAKANDIYLFNGAHIELFQQEIRQYFDPNNPTPEGIKAAKKHCKPTRQLMKLVTLACLEEGTLVRVKGAGYVPIEKVKPRSEVWDGEDWVTTDGPIYKGTRIDCISLEGVVCTPDHKFLTKTGWKRADEIKKNTTQLVRPKQPSGSWSEVWALGSTILRSKARKWLSICFSKLSPRKNCMEAL